MKTCRDGVEDAAGGCADVDGDLVGLDLGDDVVRLDAVACEKAIVALVII